MAGEFEEREFQREFEKMRLSVRLNKGKIKEEMRVPCSFESESKEMIFFLLTSQLFFQLKFI